MELQAEIDIYLRSKDWKCNYQDENIAIIENTFGSKYQLENEGKITENIRKKIIQADLIVYTDINLKNQEKIICLLGNYKKAWFRLRIENDYVNENIQHISLHNWGEDFFSPEVASIIKEIAEELKEEIENRKEDRLVYITGLKRLTFHPTLEKYFQEYI